MNTSQKYTAFISYKREDEKWAKWLQNELEEYRLPDKIKNENPNLQKKLRPIFRDVYELSAGSIAEQINNALENSEYLIVICSPHATSSQWVNSEINTFIMLGRVDHIIPFIVEGTPYSNNPDDECLPSAIRYLPNELMRLNINDAGKEVAFIKLAALMLGLKFDTLWQRHKQASFINKIKLPFSFVIQIVKNLIDSSDIYELDHYQPKKNDVNIFISYRRKDGQADARAIELALGKFGYKNVFFDYNSIREGKFNLNIIDAIYSCRDFILVLSPKSMIKCHKKRDWVAREIRTALKYKCHIIPVVIENSFHGWPMLFPKDLYPIKYLQQQQIRRDEFFEQSIKGLIERLETPIVKDGDVKEDTKMKNDNLEAMINELNESVKKLSGNETDNYAQFKVRINIPCKMIIDENMTYDLPPNKLFVIKLKKGDYLIKLISQKNETISKEIIVRLKQDIIYDLYFDGTKIIDISALNN